MNPNVVIYTLICGYFAWLYLRLISLESTKWLVQPVRVRRNKRDLQERSAKR